MTPNEAPEVKKSRVEEIDDQDGVTVDDLFPETYVDQMQVELDAETADVLTHLYLQRRIRYQASYYEQRAIEYESNADLAFRAGAILMTLSSLLASIGVVSTLPIYALLTALIPAMASFIATFRQLYQWDRQMALYRDTLLGLEQARIILPDLDLLTAEEARDILPGLIKKTESVLEKEAAQWGQMALGEGDEDGGDLFEENQATLIESTGDTSALGSMSNVLGADVEIDDESRSPLAPSGSEINTVDAVPEPTAPAETDEPQSAASMATVDNADIASADAADTDTPDDASLTDETDPDEADAPETTDDTTDDDTEPAVASENGSATESDESEDMQNIKSVG